MRRVLVCVLLFCGCHKPAPPRVLRVQVAAGPDLRQHADWRDRVGARIRAASELLQPANLQLEVAGASEWEPDPNLLPNMNRWRLAGDHSSGDWIEVGFFGSVQPGSEPGIAVPFDARVLVYEVAGAPEARQADALAHEIGHVFGAWHAQEAGTLMSLPPGEKLAEDSLWCWNVTRTTDFREGGAGLNPQTVEQLEKVWKASKAEPATHPCIVSTPVSGTNRSGGVT
jgi:hypothetical protein